MRYLDELRSALLLVAKASICLTIGIVLGGAIALVGGKEGLTEAMNFGIQTVGLSLIIYFALGIYQMLNRR